jgi:hypothetical protein
MHILPESNSRRSPGAPGLFRYLCDRFAAALTSVRFWWILCLLCGAIYAVVDRYAMNPDGLSYVDLASEFLKAGPASLINGYWSPLYPAFIGLLFRVFHPSPNAEFPVVHLANFVVFVITLTCFTLLVMSLLEAVQEHHALTPARASRQWIPFSFCMFLWCTTVFIRPSSETPDLCVTAVVLLAGAICCRVVGTGGRTWQFVALGLLLGAGYYVKAVMFPISLILLVILLVSLPGGAHNRRRVALAGVLFLGVSLPLVIAISTKVGHLSTGETGPINYAFYVNGLSGLPGWGRESTDGGALLHPPRILLQRPVILEFGGPLKGTNPLWYDPSYWLAGTRARLSLRQELSTLKVTLGYDLGLASEMVGLCGGALMLLGFKLRRGSPGKAYRRWWWAVMWPGAVAGMYGLVHVEERFLTGFVILFWLGLYSLLSTKRDYAVRSAVIGTVGCVLLLQTAVHMEKVVRAYNGARVPEYIAVGEALGAAGIRRGDLLAVVGGYTYDVGGRNYRISSAFFAYYAHFVGARIVAAVFDPSDGQDDPQRGSPAFWHISQAELARVTGTIRRLGVKAMVGLDRPHDCTQAGWIDIRGTDYSILMLREPAH